MSNNLIFNMYEGQRHVETVSNAGALPPVGSTYYTRSNGEPRAYEVEGVVFVDDDHGGFTQGWALFIRRVPMESTFLGAYDRRSYAPDGGEI